MFKRQPTDTQLIFLTLTLVLLMGIPTLNTLAESDEVAPTSRQPASIQAMPAVVKSLPSPVSTLTKHDLNCREKMNAEVQVNGELLQLQGRRCLGKFKTLTLEIENRSNGYTASVFESGTDQYQTDLIQLQKGSNEIVIKCRDANGKSVEEMLKVHASSL